MDLQKLEDFFKYDLKIKEKLHKSAPDDRYKNDSDYVSKYSDLLNETLKNLEFYMEKISSCLNIKYKDEFKKLFKIYKHKLHECGLNYSKLKTFYNVCLANMSEELIEQTRTTYVGYSDFMTLNFKNAQSINEILHVMHSYVTNNEAFYQSINNISTKKNSNGNDINLLGKENDLAKKIYEDYPIDMECGDTDILSLNNKIMIMVRDRAHALTIEISVEENKCFVQYFIPKICNALMINKLKGVDQVTNKDKYTIGQFETSFENLSKDIIELIGKVPTDEAMYMIGGKFYNEESKTL